MTTINCNPPDSPHLVSVIAGTLDRNTLGRHVREAWIRWAMTQPSPKASWLVPYDDLSEPDKEADRLIGEHVALLTKLHCDVAAALTSDAIMDAYKSGGYSAAGKLAVKLLSAA